MILQVKTYVVVSNVVLGAGMNKWDIDQAKKIIENVC